MIAGQDALDQYLVRHPQEFFGKSHEAAVIDPLNRNILKAHLPCAAKEVFIRDDDGVFDMENVRPVIEELVEEGRMKPGREGGIWLSAIQLPHRGVGIRAVGDAFTIYDEQRRIGELSGMRVFREAFPGAIYLHMGRQYKVRGLDIDNHIIRVESADVKYYTQALTHEETDVIHEQSKHKFKGYSIHEGQIRIRHQVIGYERKGLYDRQRISRHELKMPENVFETEGIWFRLPDKMIVDADDAGYDVGGTLHAFEHAAISTIPLFALCDKGDIGGISYELYPGFGTSAIFIYDGQEGGVGLSRRAYEVLEDWLTATLAVIEECKCEYGCPSCVQDSQCGNGNEPLDKMGAAWLTRRLLSEGH